MNSVEREVLAVVGPNSADFGVPELARALADVAGADVREVDVVGGADPERTAAAVLAELDRPESLMCVVPRAASLEAIGWRILGAARKAVVLVPRPVRPRAPVVSRALLPLDGTVESAAAVAGTMRLLCDAGVDLVVLHVFDATTVPRFWDHESHAEQAWVQEFLSRFCDLEGVRVQWRTGRPGDRVLDVAAAEHVDLIAVGWSQHVEPGRAQTLRRTVFDSEVPVMVVPTTGVHGGPSARTGAPPAGFS